MFNTKDITILFAGAGCGKTTYLINAFKKELNKYRPEEIAFVSFTRKGVIEGRERIIRDINVSTDSLEYCRTLHSLTFHELSLKPKQMFCIKDAQKFNKVLGFNITMNRDDESCTEDDKLLSVYDRVRSGKTEFTGVSEVYDTVRYERLINAYREFKSVNKKFDYTDCLTEFVSKGNPVPVKVAFIDEAQDLTLLQWNVCYTAFSLADKIYIAGDDYQSIYKYSGARPDVLIELSNRYKVVKLETSYRLPKSVYKLSKTITSIIGQKVDKDFIPYKNVEGLVQFIGKQEVLLNIIKSKQSDSWMCLFRNSWFASMFSEKLEAELIPYYTSHGFFIGADVLSRINRYYNFRKEGYKNSAEKEMFAKKYNITDFDNDFSASDLVSDCNKYIIQAFVDKHGIQELIRMSTDGYKSSKIIVSTIHKAKGAEAKNVAVFLDCTFKVYRTRFDDFDSELRLLYVAMTRAKDNLYVVSSNSAYGLDDIIDTVKEYCEL